VCFSLCLSLPTRALSSLTQIRRSNAAKTNKKSSRKRTNRKTDGADAKRRPTLKLTTTPPPPRDDDDVASAAAPAPCPQQQQTVPVLWLHTPRHIATTAVAPVSLPASPSPSPASSACTVVVALRRELSSHSQTWSFVSGGSIGSIGSQTPPTQQQLQRSASLGSRPSSQQVATTAPPTPPLSLSQLLAVHGPLSQDSDSARAAALARSPLSQQ
jgi:hypothetical protein